MKHDEAISELERLLSNLPEYDQKIDTHEYFVFLTSLTYAIDHLKRFQWQPIEDAPRDGTPYLSWRNGGEEPVTTWWSEVD